ncbi:SPFH domain-containing protein [Membranihabitans maritimus]|uniref:SPFH domain-containing protein n=1 Tax=Membranihabitans maritimus TaxID=2904244 RepID=UPI001F233BBA|nr:SPFH domain-containing protein [Membranihabitans maritimus]
MNNEKTTSAISGYIVLLVFLMGIILFGYFFFQTKNPLWLVLLLFLIILIPGFMIVYPNQSKVLTLFGAYKGTVKGNGFFWTNPLYVKKAISLRARNFDSERVKVNDKLGNPVLISVILVWRVRDTFKASFDVDDYEAFVRIQTDSAVRELAASYPYDTFDDDNAEKSLRSDFEEVNENLETMLSNRLDIAGIEVLEARIGYLAYAPEIASSMLKRQQATAIVAARFKIVEGAVGMVEHALEELNKKEIIDLDETKKAAMVSNLMVVLCGDRDASPVVNTGTLHQ